MRLIHTIFALIMLLATATAMAGITLPDAQKQAYLLDPTLQNLNRQRASSTLKIGQSGRLDNPEIAVAMDGLGNSDLTGLDGPSYAIQLSQSFPLNNKLSLRVDVATGEHNRLILAIDQREAELNAQVRLCLAELHVALQRVSIATADSDIALSQAYLVQAKYIAGRVVQSDTDRARALATEANNKLELTKIEAQQRQASCNVLIGDIGDASVDLATQLTVDNTHNAEQTISQRQALLLQQEAQTQLRLAEAERLPEVKLSVGVKRFEQTGDQVYLAGAAIPLPLFKQNRVAQADAANALTHATAMLEVQQKRAAQELKNTRMRLQSSQKMLITLDERVIPAATESLRIAQLAYQSGKTGLLEWIEARRVWRESRDRRLEIWLQIQYTIAGIERETGTTTTAIPLALEQ